MHSCKKNKRYSFFHLFVLFVALQQTSPVWGKEVVFLGSELTKQTFSKDFFETFFHLWSNFTSCHCFVNPLVSVAAWELREMGSFPQLPCLFELGSYCHDDLPPNKWQNKKYRMHLRDWIPSSLNWVSVEPRCVFFFFVQVMQKRLKTLKGHIWCNIYYVFKE